MAKANLGIVPVPEDHYRADLELLNQYQNYSAELVRLSLLGVAGLAFFLVNIAADDRGLRRFGDQWAGLFLGMSALLFILAMACALSHRYHAADGLYYHIKSIRLSAVSRRGESGSVDAAEGEASRDAALAAANERNRIYGRAGRWMGVAVCLFGAGGFFFVFGYGRLLYLWAFNSRT